MRASACGATVDDRYDRRNVLSPSSRFCFASGYMSFPDSQDCSVDRDINVCLGFFFLFFFFLCAWLWCTQISLSCFKSLLVIASVVINTKLATYCQHDRNSQEKKRRSFHCWMLLVVGSVNTWWTSMPRPVVTRLTVVTSTGIPTSCAPDVVIICWWNVLVGSMIYSSSDTCVVHGSVAWLHESKRNPLSLLMLSRFRQITKQPMNERPTWSFSQLTPDHLNSNLKS